MSETERKIVIPGEVLAKGHDFLPGEGTEKIGEEIIAIRYGLMEEVSKLIKVIGLSGIYTPRRGNVVIGKVKNITMNGWPVDIGTPESAFLPVAETPRFVPKEGMADVLNIGDMVVAKIFGVNSRGVDLTIKIKGLGRIEEGLIVKVNSNKVPRIIGKEGSMINLIKEHTDCDVTVGQNGYIWIQGKNIDDELLVKKVIMFIVEKSFSHGLTSEVEKWFAKEKKK